MMKYLYTGHGYNNSNTATYSAQYNTQMDVVNAAGNSIAGLITGRFPNTTAAILGINSFSSSLRNGLYYTRPFTLQSDKIVLIALDIYLANAYIGLFDDNQRYVVGLTDGRLISADNTGPVGISNQAGQYCTLIQDATGRLVLRSNSAVLATGSIALANEVWYRITIRADLQASGSFDVYVNGLQDIAYTGNTGNSITTGLYRVRIGAANLYYGTTAVWDTSDPDAWGAGFIDLETDFRPYQILPDGAGTTTNGTPVGAAANWQCVDETFRNGTTDYVVMDAVSGDQDFYTYAATGFPDSGKSVISVVMLPAANLANTGYAAVTGLAANAAETATLSAGPSMPLASGSTTYGNTVGPLEFQVDPDTGAQWDVAGVDGSQFGVLVSN